MKIGDQFVRVCKLDSEELMAFRREQKGLICQMRNYALVFVPFKALDENGIYYEANGRLRQPGRAVLTTIADRKITLPANIEEAIHIICEMPWKLLSGGSIAFGYKGAPVLTIAESAIPDFTSLVDNLCELYVEAAESNGKA